MGHLSFWALMALTLFALSLHDVQVNADVLPTESECRPYIEKAIHELKVGENIELDKTDEVSTEDTGGEVESKEHESETESGEQTAEDSAEASDADTTESIVVETQEDSVEETAEKVEETAEQSEEDHQDSTEQETQDDSEGKSEETETAGQVDEDKSEEDERNVESVEEHEPEQTAEQSEQETEEVVSKEDEGASEEIGDSPEEVKEGKSTEADSGETGEESQVEESAEAQAESQEQTAEDTAESEETAEAEKDQEESTEKDTGTEEDEEEEEEIKSRARRDLGNGPAESQEDTDETETAEESAEVAQESTEETPESKEETQTEEASEETQTDTKKDSEEDEEDSEKESEGAADESKEEGVETKEASEEDEAKTEESKEGTTPEDSEDETRPEDDLLLEVEIPENLRDRKHINELLHLDDEFEEREKSVERVADIILRDLKRIYENAIKPLETMYKYRDLSNRHFGDPEIFSKPIILFMGPWSGGKSTIINYLTGNEYTTYSLRTGAEPSPAYFNILMYGNETEILDGTQLAADWTFSGLQKFGQGLEDRLRGLKLPNKLLEKVNIVEIPGILEVRKQVSRLFPFNDACQWFIDRADIIFLVYDPAKLDVGPETEAILDQLKGREYQTRIILNKADHVKPEELLRVQSALIWNISPLMSSAQPPVMYTTSLWSHPYETSSPIRLLQAQERAFLRDIRDAFDKRIENKISSARRFAVRVRNHAKMVDCYLTTYYNHKTLFGNKKRISDQIIENPQNYHIYEGLSTLTNISRYDLPDPEVYRDFFRLNPLYEFKKLSETCTYFRGCPINKLDVAIAYDLPELVGRYKKMVESTLAKLDSTDSKS